MAEDPEPEEAIYLPELAGLLLSEQTMSGLLDVVVNLAVTAIDGLGGASISLVLRDGARLETSNASSDAVKEVDEAQYASAGGPCVEAIRTGGEVSTPVPCERWPEFGEMAALAGMRSVWSLPLTVNERTTGALNLYSRLDEHWQTAGAAPARGLARQASVVLANAAALTSARLASQHLEEALGSRDLIGQAKGVLMAQQAIGADEAFDVLRRASQRTGRKLRDVAADVIARRQDPES